MGGPPLRRLLFSLVAVAAAVDGATDSLNKTFGCCQQVSDVFQLWYNHIAGNSTSLDFALSARVPGDRWMGFGPAAPGVINRLMVRCRSSVCGSSQTFSKSPRHLQAFSSALRCQRKRTDSSNLNGLALPAASQAPDVERAATCDHND